MLSLYRLKSWSAISPSRISEVLWWRRYVWRASALLSAATVTQAGCLQAEGQSAGPGQGVEGGKRQRHAIILPDQARGFDHFPRCRLFTFWSRCGGVRRPQAR